ncbi:N-acetylglucosamine-6-phosphate deacetylase [Fictibacillus macauensis ZFHKF-1]|uniref:N-acetylglucosamine-6-phosphate deacetylase n=1 Tax=Fictibacillus macauensis ZFHKF-1 TaxID=1196324 RepID=I8J1F6_9BACL|nr:N-acetylglucosamine-6-phosphate deacetylase [Fictibacillus macauensis]EIT85561.1 N-acetylglucosamine-6-phosphate deacetylase [Fictibacillus macauensis ZFHKF-1]
MKPILLKGGTIYTEKKAITNGYLLMEGEKIVSIGEGDSPEPIAAMTVIELPTEAKILPGMIDLHIHGAGGSDVMDATEDALTTMATLLPKEGTTSFLATTMTQRPVAIEAALTTIERYRKKQNKPGKAEVLGVHLEGPFLSPKRAGAQPTEYITPPQIALFSQWQQLSGNSIKLVTFAPEERDGLLFAHYLQQQQVIASIGHSDATYEEVKRAIKAGVTHATHVYNGMRGLHHREPGVVGAVFLHEEITAEIIADGIHATPEMVKLAYQNKGSERLVLITDAMRAKCMGDGTYILGGQDVIVKGKKATLASDGALAGSILKMNEAAKNMQQFTRCSTEAIIQMTASNQAKELGIYHKKGSLTAGKDADVVVMNEASQVLYTFCRGKLAYRIEEGNDENCSSR